MQTRQRPLSSSIRHLGTSTSLLVYGSVGSRVPNACFDACVSTFSGAHTIGSSFEHSLRCWAVPDMPPNSLFCIHIYQVPFWEWATAGGGGGGVPCSLSSVPATSQCICWHRHSSCLARRPIQLTTLFFFLPLSVFAIRLDVFCTCRRRPWQLCTCPIPHSSRYQWLMFWFNDFAGRGGNHLTCCVSPLFPSAFFFLPPCSLPRLFLRTDLH